MQYHLLPQEVAGILNTLIIRPKHNFIFRVVLTRTIASPSQLTRSGPTGSNLTSHLLWNDKSSTGTLLDVCAWFLAEIETNAIATVVLMKLDLLETDLLST